MPEPYTNGSYRRRRAAGRCDNCGQNVESLPCKLCVSRKQPRVAPALPVYDEPSLEVIAELRAAIAAIPKRRLSGGRERTSGECVGGIREIHHEEIWGAVHGGPKPDFCG